MRWQPGTVILQEDYYRGHLITVFPVTVVSDTPERLVLYTAAGSTRVDGTMRDRPSMPLAERMAIYGDPEPRPMEERVVRYHALSLASDASYHSVLLFWSPAWEFLRWYVNLQLPFTRTPRGVAHGADHHGDLLLDIVVDPDLSWSWKDSDEFDAACAMGLLDPTERRLALDEAQRVIAQIEARDAPFGEPWPKWRPDPAWPVPHLRCAGPRSWKWEPAARS